MSDFVMLERQVWRDPAFAELDSDARLVFIWALSNPLASICGLYTASLRQVAGALGPVDRETRGGLEERAEAALAALGRKPLVLYDFDAELVWVINRAARANRSPKVAVAMVREVANCPPSELRDAFAARYPHLVNGGGAS